MNDNPIYIVQAYRWGDTDKHSYIVGVYSSYELALGASSYEERFRGGKYSCSIYSSSLDIPLFGGDSSYPFSDDEI